MTSSTGVRRFNQMSAFLFEI